MHPRTLATLAVVLLALGGLAAVATSLDDRSESELVVEWESDTVRDVEGNHHAPAAGAVDGTPMVYAPVSAKAGSAGCALVGVYGENGSTRWTNRIPGPNCTIHAVADPTVADLDRDGRAEVLAATTEGEVVAYDQATGTREFQANLSTYGYTQPIVADLVGGDAPEIAVVDVRGSVFVFDSTGERIWTERVRSYTWGQPSVADFDGDGAPELAVGFGGASELRVFEGNGTESWREPATVSGSITWMTTGQLDDDPAIEVLLATTEGVVAAVDGEAGDREWTRDLGRFAAVHAVEDATAGETASVYAGARGGRVYRLSGSTGETEWQVSIADGDDQMTPPPALGDLDGDGDPELLAVANDGAVAVLDPADGAVLAGARRDVAIFSRPVLANLDGDASVEALVAYGDGRVVAYEWP